MSLEIIVKPAVRKLAMERMQILIKNAISNAEQIQNFLNAKLFLLEELALDTKLECLMNLGYLFVKNANHS